LPVLAFVADEKNDRTATKASAVQKLLENVKRHRILTLEGGHYLHWTQSKRMAGEVRSFLAPAG